MLPYAANVANRDFLTASIMPRCIVCTWCVMLQEHRPQSRHASQQSAQSAAAASSSSCNSRDVGGQTAGLPQSVAAGPGPKQSQQSDRYFPQNASAPRPLLAATEFDGFTAVFGEVGSMPRCPLKRDPSAVQQYPCTLCSGAQVGPAERHCVQKPSSTLYFGGVLAGPIPRQ